MWENQGLVNWRTKYRPYIIAGVLAFVMTMFIVPKMVDGDGMAPTMKDGDIVVSQKMKFSNNRGLPEYNDVVLFKGDFIEAGDIGGQNFSRIVGLPGDEMKLTAEGVLRNGKTIKNSGHGDYEYLEKDKTLTLKGDEIFVLGDNREQAIDSRDSRVGALKLEDIRGVCVFRVWPLNGIGRIS